MTAPQPTRLIDAEDLKSSTSSRARSIRYVLHLSLLDIYLEGSDERETLRITVPSSAEEESTACSASSSTRVCTNDHDQDSDSDVEAEQLQQLAMNDGTSTASSARASSPMSSSMGVRQSNRARTPVQRLDYLLAASARTRPSRWTARRSLSSSWLLYTLNVPWSLEQHSIEAEATVHN